MKFSPDEAGGGEEQFVCYNQPTTARLQEGPQCGLVALAMAGDNLDLEEVVRTAKERGYTKQGEMFSVEDMASLARSMLDKEVEVVKSEQLLDSRLVMTRLSQGRALLVPYDCHHNHSPAMLGGTKAHWALVTGFVMPASQVNVDYLEDNLGQERADNVILLQRNIDIERLLTEHQRPRIHLIARYMFPSLILSEKYTDFLCRQSKSLVLGIWDTEELVNSNNNLLEVHVKREDGEYVVRIYQDHEDQLSY